jgi:hypothetical protein
MVRHYTSAAYKRKHEEQKLKRAEMGGGSHTQGSVPLAICKQKKVRKCILFTIIHWFRYNVEIISFFPLSSSC